MPVMETAEQGGQPLPPPRAQLVLESSLSQQTLLSCGHQAIIWRFRPW